MPQTPSKDKTRNLWSPVTENGGIRALHTLYGDWKRAKDTMFINQVSLGALMEKQELSVKDNPTDEDLREFARKIIQRYILKPLRTEASPVPEIKAYQRLIEKYGLQDIYEKSPRDFKAAVMARRDLSHEEQLEILQYEDSRQLVLLDKLFPESDPQNAEIRQHLRSLVQLTRHFYQGSTLDHSMMVIFSRADDTHFTPQVGDRRFDIEILGDAINLTVLTHVASVMDMSASEPKSVPAVFNRANERLPYIEFKSEYRLAVPSDNQATFSSHLHEININTPEIACLSKQSALEKIYKGISQYIDTLNTQVIQGNALLLALAIRPVDVFMPNLPSLEELSIKQSKILVLMATKAYLGKEIELKQLCQIMLHHPQWDKGMSSETKALVFKSLALLEVTKEQFKHEMNQALIDEAPNECARLHRELSMGTANPSEAEADEMTQKNQLMRVLQIAIGYHKGDKDADDLQEMMEAQPRWSEAPQALAVTMISRILEEKPIARQSYRP